MKELRLTKEQYVLLLWVMPLVALFYMAVIREAITLFIAGILMILTYRVENDPALFTMYDSVLERLVISGFLAASLISLIWGNSPDGPVINLAGVAIGAMTLSSSLKKETFAEIHFATEARLALIEIELFSSMYEFNDILNSQETLRETED